MRLLALIIGATFLVGLAYWGLVEGIKFVTKKAQTTPANQTGVDKNA